MAVNGLVRPVRISSKDGSTNGENDHLLPKLTTQFSGGPTVGGAGTPNVRQRQFTVGELQALQPGSPATEARAAKPRYESLDYEEVENIVYRSDKAAGGALDGVMLGLSKWTVCFLIGVLTAVAAFFVNFSVENIAGFKFWATLTILGKGYKFGSFLAYASMNMVLVLMAVGMTLFVGPAAAGSGIPDVKAYLNGIDVPGIFYFSTLAAKLLGSITAVAGGLAIGKEGPFVHAGACIAALISQGGTQSCHTRITHHLWNDRDRADMVTAGAAAGVAAAFRSPVGGVLFALEEMSSWWRNQLMWLIFFTTAVVSVTVRFLMKACSASHCGFFGSGGFIYFEIEDAQDAFEIYELLPMLLLGVVGGLLGSSFIVLNGHLAHLRKKHLAKYGVRGRLAEGAAISALTSMVSFLLPLFFICQRCPKSAGDMCPRKDDSHSGNFVAFGCTHPNQYSDLATLFFNTQDDAIRALFSSSTKREYSVPTLLLFVTSFYFLAVITYGMSCPTGLFVPSILCGAAYGRLVGIFVADMYPHMHVDEGTYALLGAASFLGGSMRMAVCTCVMLLELTNNLALLPLVMLVLLVAKAVGDGTGIKPIYEMQMQYKGLPFLEPSPDPIMRHLTAKECCGRPPVTLNRVERVSRIVDILRSCSHNGFPVLHTTNADGDKALAGVVLRQHLLLLLTSRNAFQTAPYVTEAASRVATTFSVSDFQKPISAPGLSIHDVKLSTEELCQYLDLGPYLNPSYYVVQDDASLSKVYTLFRTLGVRHLCVIPKAHEVVGIITREDLQSEIINERLEAGGGQFGTDGTLAGSSRARRGFGDTPSSSGRRSLGTSPFNTPDTSVRDGAMSGRAMQSRMQLGGAGASTATAAAAAAVGDGGVLALGNRTRTSYTGEQKNRTSYTGEPKGRTRTSHTGATGGNAGAGGGFGNPNFGGGRFTEQQGIDLLPNLPSNEVPMGPGPSGLHRTASMRKTPEQGVSSPGAGFGVRSALSVLGSVAERAPLLGLPPRAGGRATVTELASIPDDTVTLRGDLLDIESGKGFKSRRTGSSRPGTQVVHKD